MSSDFQVLPLAPFGAELVGDLSRPLSSGDKALLLELSETHGLLVARNQTISLDRQRELMELFGPVPRRELNYVDLGDGVLNADPLTFHSDMAFCHTPYRYGSLHALELEGGRTSTVFANGALAYRRLGAEQRKLLARLTTLAISTSRSGRAYLEATARAVADACKQTAQR